MKFSIIIPTHNRAHLIQETIDSVLAQTYTDFEIVIVDDGSNDDTEKIINSYGNHVIDYIKLKRIGKLSVLRNHGMQRATGDFITFLDSDDILDPDKLLTVHNIFVKNPEINLVIHNLSIFNNNGIVNDKVYSHTHSFKRNILKELLKNKFLPYSSYVFRKTILKDIGLINENLNDGQHDFLTRLVAVHSVYFEPTSLIKLREHSDSMSESMSDEIFEKYILGALEEYLVTLKHLWEDGKISKQLWNDRKSYTYYTMAMRLKKQKKTLQANAYFRDCISIRPFALNSLKAILHYNYFSKKRHKIVSDQYKF